MTDITINVDTWNKQRELPFCPKHFVTTNTPLTEQSKLWVLEKLHGRYHITGKRRNLFSQQSIFDDDVFISFEDPQEATFYELTWS